MKLSMLGAVVTMVSVAWLAGCSGSDGAISVDGAGGALTDEANDTLFTLKVDEARDGGYALAGLEVKVAPDGADAFVATCTPADANANGKLDEGETLVCKEGATNVLGKASAGKEHEVELFAQIDGEATRVGSATWTP